MNKRIRLTVVIYLMTVATLMASPREIITLTSGWKVWPIISQKAKTGMQNVTVPHTWNAAYPEGTTLYNREMMVYQRELNITPEMKGKRLFLYFEGINSAADIFVNKQTVGTHLGGYTACSFEITDYVTQGENQLEIWVSNAYRTDILPISGDFNVYGGIHRPCHLIVTGENCISPVFYASPGIFVHQNKVSEKGADITIETILSLKEMKSGLMLKTTICDSNGKVVAKGEALASEENMKQDLHISNPTLWNGKKNPYLYQVTVELYDNGVLKDKMTQHTGFRYFSVDPDKGFFLNGQYLDLYGFCRHEDMKGKGSALTMEDYQTDMELILESGATAMRLVHYPHAEPIYDLSDINGIVLWTEIPFCGPGGYPYTGYVKSVEQNARQTVMELVYQKYNHPSVMFWGIFNEILVTEGRFVAYDDPVPFVKELNDIFRKLDSSRLTTVATCVNQNYYLGVSDLLAWNKYFGWKTAENSYAHFFDQSRSTSGGQAVGVSEYGAAASIHHHSSQPDIRSDFHPEESQNLVHEGAWKAFAERPYLWGKFIWAFADFQSFIRKEGDTDGINDKGLITYDRKIKKDAFYFYKANWNPEPMLYITSRRFTERTEAQTEVKVYTNLSEATLYVNGKKIGKQKKSKLGIMIWKDIRLAEGQNEIKVEGKAGKHTVITDNCTWMYR